MERYTANPLDEVDRLQAVIRRLEDTNNDLRDEVTALKARILAASDILGSGASKFDQKPASASKATNTSSVRQQSAPKLPAELAKRAPSTTSVRTTPLIQGLRKPQVSQVSKPADNPWLQAGAEHFALLGTGRRPDLPSTRLDELTIPDLSKFKNWTEFDLAEYRRSFRKQAAEGTLPPFSEEKNAEWESFRRLLAKWRGKGISFSHIIEDEDVEDEDVEDEDVEDRDVPGVDTTENLYDVSDTEDSESREVLISFVNHTELTKRPDTKDQSKDEGHREPEAVPTLPKTLGKQKVSHMPPRANTNVVASNSVPLADGDDRKLLAAFQDASETIKGTINSMLRLDLGKDLRQAGFAEGKRKHSDTDETFTRKRARATGFTSAEGEMTSGTEGDGEEEEEEHEGGLEEDIDIEDGKEDNSEWPNFDIKEDDEGPEVQKEEFVSIFDTLPTPHRGSGSG